MKIGSKYEVVFIFKFRLDERIYHANFAINVRKRTCTIVATFTQTSKAISLEGC